MQIYLITGSNGQYDDYEQWAVFALRDREQAQKWVGILTKEAKEWEEAFMENFMKDNWYDKEIPKPPNDPNFKSKWGRNNIEYCIDTITLKE